jgi:hypothetical protein
MMNIKADIRAVHSNISLWLYLDVVWVPVIVNFHQPQVW